MPLPLVTVVRSISEAKIATEGHPALAAPLEDALPASAIELIAAPSGLGLSRPDGRVPRVDLLPQALLDAGLGQGLQFVAAQPVRVPAYVPLRDPATGLHNGPGIAAVAHELADRVQAA